MATWIKNNTGSGKTWVGQTILSGEYYQIQNHEALAWANNSTLLSDIGSGDAIVAKDDSGTTDIVDVNEAIDYLKGDAPVKIDSNTPIRNFPLAESSSLRARLLGIFNQTVTKNQTTNLDWQIPHTTYLGQNKQSYMDGIQYYAENAEVGDTMKFQVVDVDGLVYPAGTVLDEFGTDWAVMPNKETTIRLYKAKLIPGLYIRVVFSSTGTTNDIKLVCNLFRHMDTDINL